MHGMDVSQYGLLDMAWSIFSALAPVFLATAFIGLSIGLFRHIMNAWRAATGDAWPVQDERKSKYLLDNDDDESLTDNFYPEKTKNSEKRKNSDPFFTPSESELSVIGIGDDGELIRGSKGNQEKWQ